MYALLDVLRRCTARILNSMTRDSIYCFLGPELGEKKTAIDAIRARLVKAYGAPPEETSFYVGETEVPQIISAALNGSLFADARLFFVKNADFIKKKEDVNALCSYLKNPQQNTTLILISEQTKIEAGIEKYFTSETKKIFWELFEEKKTQYIEKFFREAGCAIEPAAVSILLEFVENNTDALRQECSKIALFLKNQGITQITEEKIEHLLAHSKQETVFSLFSAITKGDFAKSLGITHALLAAQTVPQAIFGYLSTAFRKFRDYCELAARGADNDFELRKVGITTLGKRDYISARRVFGTDAPDTLLALTAEYDITSRANAQHSGIIMDMYLYAVFKLAQRP